MPYEVNFYVLDKIEEDEDFPGLVYGYLGEEKFEVYYQDDSDEEYLRKNGFCYCDAPNWEDTMITEETNFSYNDTEECSDEFLE